MDSENGEVLRILTEDQRVAVLRERLMAARKHTRSTLAVLQAEVIQKTDWRGYVRADPGPWLFSAFMIGFLLAKRR